MGGGKARARCATWPEVDFIIGNPPFLGSSFFRKSFGNGYTEKLFDAFDLPKTSDLCCYWFELARRRIVDGEKSLRIGLLATQGIRGGASRAVLERISAGCDIFEAWADRDWVLDGAAVHVSIIAFTGVRQSAHHLDGVVVGRVNADLSSGANTVMARALAENANIAFRGNQKGGDFDIEWTVAREMLATPNSSGSSNSSVIRPYENGMDMMRRSRAMWLVDFGVSTSFAEAASFEAPFAHIEKYVKPVREHNRRDHYREKWWIHNEPRPGMRNAISNRARFCVCPHVAKHFAVVWMIPPTLPDHQLIAFARSDDYFVGVVQSSLHEVWFSQMGTQLEDRPRYTPSSTFETFPIPWPPGKEPSPRPSPGVPGEGERVYLRIAAAAKALNEQRERWLNPPEWIEQIAAKIDAVDTFEDVPKEARGLIRQSAIMAAAAKDARLKKRTLTNLYNERPTWLKIAHEQLDRAVLAAYAAVDPEGEWSEDWAEVWVDSGAGQALPADHPLAGKRGEVDQKVLGNLLRLNHERGRSASVNGQN